MLQSLIEHPSGNKSTLLESISNHLTALGIGGCATALLLVDGQRRDERPDLLTPEALHGDRRGQHSIRINNQFRICFVWSDEGPGNVEITDYH